ncbi:MAG: DUF3879 family protein [Clostridia bacterium]|nr:DUF3879 family protein [Clostridia bacterium]
MNISSNNMKWLSQNSLTKKLFSQTSGKTTDVPKQVGSNSSGGVKYRHSNMYYDENGIPWRSKEEAERCITGRSDWRKIVSVSDEVKADLAEVVKQDFISTNGLGIPEGTRRNDVINKYLSTIAPKNCASVCWTLDNMTGDYATKLTNLVRENNPGWKPGDAFDTSILDQLDGALGGVDFKI